MHTPPRAPCGALIRLIAVALAILFADLSPVAWAKEEATKSFDIQSGDAAVTLKAFSEQSGLSIMFSPDQVKGIETKPVHGDLPPQAALDRLLSDTPLYATPTKTPGAFSVRRETKAGDAEKNVNRAIAQDSGRPSKAKSASDSDATEGVIKLETFEVMGSKLLNMDKPRTRDDAQPYVVFNHEQIERSQAVTLDDFMRTRLPMNTQQGFTNQATFGTGISNSNSSINLRGLGTNQTLILVDGRRMPSVSTDGSPTQPDINGIPLMMVERIEILPSSASGIYGGSATGGVVNIILRRDYAGSEIKGTYTNTFDTDTATKRVDFGSSCSLEGGLTRLMVSGSWAEANNVAAHDREFIRKAIALQMANNPGLIMNSSTPFFGTTPNVRSVNGSNLVLDPMFGGASLGSNITYIPLGYLGPNSDNGAALVANAGKYNLNPADGGAAGARGLLAAPKLNSLMFSLRRKFVGNLEAFVDLSHTENTGWSSTGGFPASVSNLPADAPNNPFQQAVNVRFPSAGDLVETHRVFKGDHAAIGLIARLPREWMTELDWNWNRSSQLQVSTSPTVDNGAQAALNTGLPPADGRPALNALQEGNTFPRNFTPYLLLSPNVFDGPDDDVLSVESLRLGGPAFQLPGGSLALTVLVQHRNEQLKDQTRSTINPTTRSWQYTFWPNRSQEAWAYYMEAHAPLFSKANAITGVSSLEIQLSARREKYETRAPNPNSAPLPGTLPAFAYTKSSLVSSNFTVAVSFTPVSDLALRASVSTGFLPPSVVQIAQRNASTITNIGSDPKRGNTEANVGLPITFLSGGGPNLRPEKSQNVSGGLILTPHLLPGFRLSIDYTRIRKSDEITTPSFQFVLDHEDQFPGRIVRGANLPGDPSSWAGIITQIDTSLLNVARSEVEAYDIQADYTRSTKLWGEFHGYAVATYQPHYWQQTLPTVGIQENAGFSNGPLKLRGNLGLDWRKGPLTVGLNAQYYHSYYIYGASPAPLSASQIASRATQLLNQGSDTIPRQIYYDLIVSYRVDHTSKYLHWFADTEISVGLQNIFNTSPPIVAASFAGDAGYSLYGDPRLRRYTLSIRKQFH